MYFEVCMQFTDFLDVARKQTIQPKKRQHLRVTNHHLKGYKRLLQVQDYLLELAVHVQLPNQGAALEVG